MTRQKFWILPVLLGGTFLSMLLFLMGSSVTEINANTVDEGIYSCRYGVTINDSSQTTYLDDLKMGWYSNFVVNYSGTISPGIEYVPTVRMQQARDSITGDRLPDYVIVGPPLTDNPDGLGPIIQAHPGSLWLVGNEVDRIDWQDDLMPEIYAKAYHDVYQFIKDRDPSAQIANSGLVQVTPGRLQYLDIVWDTYLELYDTPMPVDVWNMHIYILPEARLEDGVRVPSALANVANGTDINLAKLESDGTPNLCGSNDVYCFSEHDDMNIFAEQVVAMRQWMKAHGQQQKPLILSEYSQLYPYIPENGGCFLMDESGNCFTETRVTTFMNATLAYFENTKDANLGYGVDDNRLVQQWLWYTINSSDEGASSNLVYLNNSEHPDGTLTPMGTAYRQAAISQLTVNLLPETNVIPVVVQGVISAPLTVTVRNNGSIPVSVPFTVTFYSDAALTQEIGSYQITDTIGGCTRQYADASVVWSGLTPGINYFWGIIDSGDDVAGEDKSDNTFTGFVLVDPNQTFLPIMRR
jgi:hypothetical protein